MKILKKIYSKIRHWCCEVGLCNFDSCGCGCHENAPKTTIVKNVFKPHLDEVTPPKQEDNFKKMIEERESAPQQNKRPIPRYRDPRNYPSKR